MAVASPDMFSAAMQRTGPRQTAWQRLPFPVGSKGHAGLAEVEVRTEIEVDTTDRTDRDLGNVVSSRPIHKGWTSSSRCQLTGKQNFRCRSNRSLHRELSWNGNVRRVPTHLLSR